MDAKLLPICAYDKLLTDKVTVFFTSGTSSEWILATLRTLGIETYSKMTSGKVEADAYGNAQKYAIYLDAVIGALHQDQLEALWNMGQVKFLNQELIRNPYLPPREDSDY